MSIDRPQFVRSKDGTRIAYYVEGDGPVLFYVYGALSDRTFWGRLLPHLDGFQHCLIERRGRGESGDAAAYDPQREAEDVAAVLETFEGPVNVFAHSSGAVVALAGMQLAPRQVRRAVLYEPPFVLDNGLRTNPPEDFVDQLRAILATGDRAGAMEYFYRNGPQLPEADIQRQKAGSLWRSLEPLAHTMVYDAQVPRTLDLARLRDPAWVVPTLLLYGEASPPWVIEGVRALAANLGSSSLAELPKQGHVAMFTAPELLAGEIKGFFRAG